MASAPVLITLDYPPETGGVARYLGEFVRASGNTVDVVVSSDHDLSGPGRTVIARNFFRIQRPKWWPLIRVCQEFGDRPYLIVSHVLPVGTAALIAKWLGGAPYVLILHGLDINMATRSAWKKWLFRRVCHGARLLIVNSEHTKALVQAQISNREPLVLTPGVRMERIPPRDEARRVFGINNTQRIVLAVARLVERKGIDTLIHAVAQDPELILLIVGSGPEESKLRALAEEHNTRVIFLTAATDDDVAHAYAAADIFALPVRENAHDIEGYGIVFLEAALAGLPVIAGKTGGAQEAVLDGYTGFLVEPDDAELLAKNIRILIEDAELRQRMGEAGKLRTQKEFQWEDRWQKFEDAMKRL